MFEINRIGKSEIHDKFLAEQGLRLLSAEDEAVSKFRQWSYISLYFPGEHCTECGAPDCHQTCDLFDHANTGFCRRFADGIVAKRTPGGPCAYSLEVLFKPWGCLLCVGNTFCMSMDHYRRWQAVLVQVGRMFHGIQVFFRFLPDKHQWWIADKIRGLGNRIPRFLNRLAARKTAVAANSLVIVTGNPQTTEIPIEISVSGFGDSQGGRSYRRVEMISHGWLTIEIPVREIATLIDLSQLFRISVVPIIDKPALLQFAAIGFVAKDHIFTTSSATKEGKKIKLLVVDLDNTLWDGIVIEESENTRELKPGIREVLTELDQRGILLSIVSKNNPEDVRMILESQGVWDLFLYPQISWQPKSAGIMSIVQRLNIGLDTVAFIDDSEFERAEVSQSLPEVRVYNEALFCKIPQLDEFTVMVTEESRGRRNLYREEQNRQVEFEKSDLNYDGFLASCNIRLSLSKLGGRDLDRVHELVQRTNQLNFSGTRYTREDFSQILKNTNLVPVVMRCDDRFGSYGIVGFSLLEMTGLTLSMNDLMFSCRIQGKKIEHAFLSYLVADAKLKGFDRILCKYNRTKRNAAAAKVFDDLGFRLEVVEGSRETYFVECGATSFPRFPATIMDETILGICAGASP